MTTAVWAHGGTVVIPSTAFNPSTLVAAIAKYGVTNALIPPAALNELDSVPSFATTNVSSLKALTLGGDVSTQDLYIKAANTFPHCEIIVSYGMTEGASAFYAGYSGFTGMDVLRAAGVSGDKMPMILTIVNLVRTKSRPLEGFPLPRWCRFYW